MPYIVFFVTLPTLMEKKRIIIVPRAAEGRRGTGIGQGDQDGFGGGSLSAGQ